MVLCERKSRYTIAQKLRGKNAEETAKAVMSVFQRLDPSLRRSATFDNDTAFARHARLRQALLRDLGLNVKISFNRGVAHHF